MTPLPDLPVAAILPRLAGALEEGRNAVLVAPPGAGKTTLVPLSLLTAPWAAQKRIVLLEPRRLAARAAARRMAALLDEEPGGQVGYAMRMDSRQSDRTRILVVTEGVMARMILDDPELPGVAALVFDEFHERSLDGDFALALALDIQSALRPDLRLLAMSATLDGARVARLMGKAPVIESPGRAFPVEIRHRERQPGQPIEETVAEAVSAALAEEDGSVLAFLPGQREIERAGERLAGRLAPDVDVVPLYGALEGKSQDAAIRPAPAGRRKVVLATSIAETSITIDGVRVVIDSGLSRLPRYEPGSGLTRLVTVRASRASADQRAGRAGRTGPGVAIRLWRAEQTGALPAFTPPEILEADLSGLVLDCAAFGVADPASLAFLDPPPAPALAEARALLRDLDAIDAEGRLTSSGDRMRRLALPPRLAHMVAEGARTRSGREAAEIAMLLTERGLGGNDVDLDHRLRRFRADKGPRALAARNLARRIAERAGNGQAGEPPEAGAMLLLAYPDRVARRRGTRGQFLLASGAGATLDEADPLAGEDFLVVAELTGAARDARIRAAAAITEADIRAGLGERIERTVETVFDRERRSVRNRERERLGAIVLRESNLPPPSGAAADRAVLDAVRAHCLAILPWNRDAATLRRRLYWLAAAFGPPWPSMQEEALVDRLDEWLLPFLEGRAELDRIGPDRLARGLLSLVPHGLLRDVDRLAPTHFEAPSGSRIPISYEGEQPVLAIRVQELFGLDSHPSIAAGRVSLTVELLSPAHRPIQVTRDLPGFWRGSWNEVRSAMRGRYPKHVWPEDPLAEKATARAKPRHGA